MILGAQRQRRFKAVLLKHIIGLETPGAGEILINGQPIQSPETMDRYRMAMVFQSGALLNSLTVGENVGLYLSEHRLKSPEEIERIVAEKLESVGLRGTEDQMPSELSGGMKKRAAIARALVIEPQLILYDEPTSELDPLSAVVIGEEILDLNRRIHVTSLVVSHDRDLAFGVADRIAVIHEGAIVAIGTPDEIRRRTDPMIQRFLHADFKRHLPS
ncbi:MAG: ATP-binding cassette domain-containing protein [Verrucomicrobiota bacterium]